MRLICSQTLQLLGGSVFPVASTGLLLLVFQGSIESSKAISLEPPSHLLAQNSQLANRVLFVDPRQGRDSLATGSQAAPFKTITQALKVARPNAVIQLAVGTYSAQSGETFPIQLKSNITIQGNSRNRGHGITIQGGGRFVSLTSAVQNVAVLGANQAQLIGVTVSNLNRRGYGLWIESTNTVVTSNTFTANQHDGISVVGSAAPTIRSNHFFGNGANGITIYGTAQPELRDNIFDSTGFGISINQQAAPTLIGNRITRNKDGVIVQASAQPILRRNTIENNSRDGLVAIAESRPDLGTVNQPGGNIFRNNGQYDIHNAAKNQIISAFGNQVTSNRTAGQIDLTNTVTHSPLANQSALPSIPATPSNSENFAIEIPVEVASSSTRIATTTLAARPPALPTQTASSQPQPARSSQVLLTQNQLVSQEATVIEIPVPPPVSNTPTEVISPPLPSSTPINPGGISSNLLPVPSAPIPLGNAGSSSAVFVTRGTLSSTPGSPPPPPLKVAPLGPRFRVVVEAKDLSQQAQIRSLVPDAFRSFYKGRAVMQVGSFKERTKVDAMIHLMTNNGLNPIVELRQ